MKHTISALVRNRPGVLAEMAAQFKKRELNITSISSGETENPDVSRMVICLEAAGEAVTEIVEAMKSMDFVVSIDDLSRKEFVDRELVLVKVKRESRTLTQIMQILEVFRAGGVGVGETTVTVEMSGDEDRVEGLIRMLEPFGIVSMCRTGKIALKRGDD